VADEDVVDVWMMQIRRWGGAGNRLARVVYVKQTGAHYLILSIMTGLDTAGKWLSRVPIVKLQYSKPSEGVPEVVSVGIIALLRGMAFGFSYGLLTCMYFTYLYYRLKDKFSVMCIKHAV
jgi:hypothetical protein